ncbi:MBOAT family O-acyltransferase [Leptospira sp. GIMC2001]|uniref:MBOAT family O-acyltransferase n=1 Tax=Leptospira sp. GIMC2001 TaxID=1513297 RepID=UPI00234B35D8|nr:MBOAT family O-acyltransferase [Leptospira sp. GIMC2001]WCL48920.1 MBOAT family protein [Leptospira sp. GIMC2001]
MLFNSLPFLLFFAVFLFFYYNFHKTKQNQLLLVSGIFFYSFWDWRMTFLLLVMILFNFKLGKYIFENTNSITKRKYFIFGIVTNLFVLGFFKYAMFLLGSGNDLAIFLGFDYKLPIPEIILPIGISFYTFHNISYLFDIYRQVIKPTESLLEFAVYDLFFPLLLAGPIERPSSLLPQISNPRRIESVEWNHGFLLFLWGIFKKVFIADNLSPFVDKMLSNPSLMEPGIVSWVALCFAFQVYADFSGYTDAARGMAKMLGFRLMLNFNLPFFATSVAEFWKRWHISLSSWLRDYLYIPLGGNRIGLLRQNINIVIVWTLGGLWHGATYGYLIWGIYCGLNIVFYNVLMQNRWFKFDKISNLLSVVGWFVTFWSFAYGLLLFRVPDWNGLIYLLEVNFGFYFNLVLFLKILFFISPILIVDGIQFLRKESEPLVWFQAHPILLYSTIMIGIILFLFFGIFEKMEFFYFQF